MTSVEQHRERVLALVRPTPVDRLPLAACRGLVLAEPLAALLPVPAFDNSAMDGFAVLRADLAPLERAPAGGPVETFGVVLEVVGEVAAGQVADRPFAPGQAWRIMTGAAIPDGCDQVVPVELTDQPGGDVPLPEQVVVRDLPGRDHIRRAGEDVAVGDPVLAGGTLLDAACLAAAASVGHAVLPVHRRPRVAVLATGSELVAPGDPLPPGHIPDSNSLLLAGLVADAGAELVHVGHVDDRPGSLAEVARQLVGAADLLVTTGGVSVGSHDVMHTLPGLSFDHLELAPGGPQGWGRLADELPVVALPGNPVAAHVGFHLFVVPVLQRLAGQPEADHWLTAVADGPITSRRGRHGVVPVVLRREGATLAARDALPRGSHRIATLHRADALAEVPADVDAIPDGGLVRVLPLH